LFKEITDLLDKIERWWILNVEIPTNPEFDGEEIDEDGIVTNRIITLWLLTGLLWVSRKSRSFTTMNLWNEGSTYNTYKASAVKR